MEREATRIPVESDVKPDLGIHLAEYLYDQLGATAGGVVCPLRGGMRVLQANQGYLKAEAIWDCPSAEGIEIRGEAFVDLVDTHVNFARVRTVDGVRAEYLFTAQQRSWKKPAPGAAPEEAADSSVFDFIVLGIKHILSGLDHMAFLIGVMLICRNFKDVAFVITGFTLGHSLTLGLAVLGLVRPDVRAIEASIGLTIALVAAENVVLATGRGRPVALAAGLGMAVMAVAALLGFGKVAAPIIGGFALFSLCYLLLVEEIGGGVRLRIGITTIFGLIHGFGFADALIEARLPPDRLVAALFGFNIGVEIGQLMFVAALAVAAALVAHTRLAPSRPLVGDLASAALCGLGLFWFVERTYS